MEFDIAGNMVVEVDNTLKKGDKSYPARVEMTTRHGETYTQQVDEPLESLERPMSLDASAEKFRVCAKRLKRGQTEKAIDLVAHLELEEYDAAHYWRNAKVLEIF